MLKTFLSAISLLLTGLAYSQTTINGSFEHGRITRTYSFYVPASYNPSSPVPLVIGLHGLSSNGADFAEYRDFRPIADTANFIIVNPDGSRLLGVRFWNYGNLGSTVDDVGFLEALIDTISAHYAINPGKIYCTGMSNGSFMTYYMACRSNRFAAVAGVTGSMSRSMHNSCSPARPTPTLHIHGTDDDINPYDGTSSMLPIDDLIEFWVNQNQCNTTPVVTNIPNTNPTDGATATRYRYAGGVNGNTVEHIMVNNGGHSWPGSPMPGSNETVCMDFNASVEIWRFFLHHENSNPTTIDPGFSFSVYPNPSSSIINISSDQDLTNKNFSLSDISGRKILSGKLGGQNPFPIDLSNYSRGVYILSVDTMARKVVRW